MTSVCSEVHVLLALHLQMAAARRCSTVSLDWSDSGVHWRFESCSKVPVATWLEARARSLVLSRQHPIIELKPRASSVTVLLHWLSSRLKQAHFELEPGAQGLDQEPLP